MSILRVPVLLLVCTMLGWLSAPLRQFSVQQVLRYFWEGALILLAAVGLLALAQGCAVYSYPPWQPLTDALNALAIVGIVKPAWLGWPAPTASFLTTRHQSALVLLVLCCASVSFVVWRLRWTQISKRHRGFVSFRSADDGWAGEVDRVGVRGGEVAVRVRVAYRLVPDTVDEWREVLSESGPRAWRKVDDVEQWEGGEPEFREEMKINARGQGTAVVEGIEVEVVRTASAFDSLIFRGELSSAFRSGRAFLGRCELAELRVGDRLDIWAQLRWRGRGWKGRIQLATHRLKEDLPSEPAPDSLRGASEIIVDTIPPVVRLKKHQDRFQDCAAIPGVVTLEERDGLMAHLLVIGPQKAELKVAIWPETVEALINDQINRGG